MLHSAIIKKRKGSIQGYGLFTQEFIRKDSILWVLDEPIYSWQEVLTWDKKRRQDFDHYGFQCGVDSFSLPEDLSREANHSCDPNTWWRGHDTLIARRDIQKDEEVTYDYATCDIDLHYKMECSCGSHNCRKTISNMDYMIKEWQQQYKGYLPPHVLNAINKIELK